MTLIRICDKRKRHRKGKCPERTSSLDTENSQLKSKIKTYNTIVNLFASRCRIRNTPVTKAKISKYHILENGNTSQDICRKILSTNVGLRTRENIDISNVIPMLSPIMQKFKIRHNKFNYFNKLKHVTTRNNSQQEYQISKCSLKSFFNLLLYENVPLELFGTSRNLKAIKKMIYCLLETAPKKIFVKQVKSTVPKVYAVGGSLNILPLFDKLDIYSIKWLRSVHNDTKKCIIVLKLLRWFFAQYIVKILHKYMVVMSVKDQWVYIAKDDWCRKQEQFIKEQKSTCNLVPHVPVKQELIFTYLPIRRYKFVPTTSGLRALSIASYDAKEEFDDVDVVLRFLQQLHVTFNDNGTSTMASCKTAIEKFGRSTRNKLFFVRCDIQDAFGSIKQDKLYDIIKTQWEKLPCYLAMRSYTLPKNKKKDNNSQVNGRQTVQFLTMKRQISAKYMNKEKPMLVSKRKLLAKINQLIFGQKIKLDNQIYLMKSGVPQGAQVSPIFSEIYYRHMIKEKFSDYEKNGCLCMYVDDILYITESEHYAASFLEKIQNGVLEYNVKFNPSKIQKNVSLWDKVKEITFLGWNIKFID